MHSIWTDVMKEVENIGFVVAVTMTDGHSIWTDVMKKVETS